MAALSQSNAHMQKAGQTQTTLLGSAITGIVFALAHGAEKVFLWHRKWMIAQQTYFECVWRGINITEWTKTGYEWSIKQKEISEVDEKRAEASWQTSSQQVRHSCGKSSEAKQSSAWPTLCRRIQSILRRGRHDELQMNSLVSVGAERSRPCDWMRLALHIWKITKARFGQPSPPPHVWEQPNRSTGFLIIS